MYKCTKVDKNALYAKSISDKFKTLSKSTSDRLSARRSMVFLFIIRFFVYSFFFLTLQVRIITKCKNGQMVSNVID